MFIPAVDETYWIFNVSSEIIHDNIAISKYYTHALFLGQILKAHDRILTFDHHHVRIDRNLSYKRHLAIMLYNQRMNRLSLSFLNDSVPGHVI
jgi:hypothetical protein